MVLFIFAKISGIIFNMTAHNQSVLNNDLITH
jgi:hypothetical protein